jgi:hypothetical protein
MLNVTELIGFGAGEAMSNPLVVARGASVSAGDAATIYLTATSGGVPESATRKIIILAASGGRTPSSMSCTVDGVAATLLGFYTSGSHAVAAFIASVPAGASWAVVVSHVGGDTTGEGSIVANWCVDNLNATAPAVAISSSGNTVVAGDNPAAWLWAGVRYGGAVGFAGVGFTATTVISTHPWTNWWYESVDYLSGSPDLTESVTGAGLMVGVALY